MPANDTSPLEYDPDIETSPEEAQAEEHIEGGITHIIK